MLVIGGLSGLIGGYLGIGGGVLLVPLYNEYLRYKGVDLDHATLIAASSSLAVTFFSAGSAAINRWRRNELVIEALLPVLSGALAGSLLGVWAAATIPGKTVRLIFMIFLIMLAMHLITEKKVPQCENENILIKPLFFVGLGILTGFFSSLLGIGGGVMLVPMFLVVFRFPWHKASGTSSALASATALIGVFGYVFLSGNRLSITGPAWGVVDWKTALPVSVAAVAATHAGVSLSQRFGERVFRLPFIILLLFLAWRVCTCSFLRNFSLP